MAVPKVTEIETLVLKHWSQQKEQLVVFLSTKKTGMSRTTAVLRTQEVIKLCLDAVTVCHSKLPGYMVPTHVIPVTSLPLTNNNKIDVNALRVTYDALSRRDLLQVSGRDGAKSLNQTERIIAAAISQVTRVEMEDIRQSSSIFELGVDSISAIALSRSLRQQGLSAAEPAVVMKSKRNMP
jgi:aryl carrier-like protein